MSFNVYLPLRFWRQAQWRLVLLLVSLAQMTHATTLELHQAQAVVTVQGQTSRGEVSLPYHWDVHQRGLAGEATFELLFDLPEVPTVPFGLYVPRLGNAYEIWLNGVLLQRNGDLKRYNGPDYAKEPRFVEVEPDILRTDGNVFRVRIRADVGRRGGLAALKLGPEDEVYPLYASNFRWRSTGSQVIVILSLLIGLMALALWATQFDMAAPGQNQRDPLYLYAGLAELCWAVSVSDAVIENPPISWPWWGLLAFFSVSAWMVAMILFCAEVAGWSRLPAATWLRRWLMLVLVVSVAAGIGSLVYGEPLAMTLTYATLGLTALVFAVLVVVKSARGASMSHKIMAISLLFNALVGLRDLYVFRISPVYGSNTWLRYSSVLFGLTLGYIVLARFRTASAQVRDSLENLANEVKKKELELAQAYAGAERAARQQERSAERTRILRDMHDGVGAHISTAIRQLQSGKASDEEVLHTMRDSLDQLKMSIDAMNLPPGDVTALLANLRYRLEPRFKASDVDLQWDVDWIPPLVRLDDRAMRHLQFMVYEALSNVLQHAHAKTLLIEATPVLPFARIRVIDNGRGFDVTQPSRRGIRTMRDRATAVGATISFHSSPGHTVVEILIPVTV